MNMWHNRKYHFYLLFADTIKNKEPWAKETWKKDIQPIFDEIIKKSAYYKKTGLDVLSYKPKPNSEYLDLIKFGKLRWNEKSFEKWTTTKANKEILFTHLDSWTPMRTVCAKIDSPPDVYISIASEQLHPKKEEIKFDIFMVIAIAEELKYDGLNEVTKLSKIVNSKKTVYIKRCWGGFDDSNENAQWSFINSIQYTTPFGIYKAKTLNIHDTKFEELKFEPYWTIIYPN